MCIKAQFQNMVFCMCNLHITIMMDLGNSTVMSQKYILHVLGEPALALANE